MKYKLECINDQFCQMYFGFSAAEVDKLFEDVFDEFTFLENTEDAILEVKEKIEFEILEDKINELDLVIIGPRTTKFMTQIKKGNPIMGISEMCILPDDINISLPTFIPEELYKFEIDIETIKNFIKEIMLCNNLYKMEKVDIIDEDCIVSYDLCYTNDDLLINKIENQEFDMQNDDEFNPKIFMNRIVGNEVIIDKSEIVTLAKITKIEKKVPFELTDELVTKIKFGGIKTVNGFIKKIKTVLEFQKDIQISIFYITEAIINSEQFKFSDVVINYFLKAVAAEGKKKESLKMNIKRMLITEYLIKIVELKTDDEDLTPETKKKMDELSKLVFLADGRKSQTFTRTLFDDQYRQVKFLEYCKEAGLISNIRL